MRKAMWKKGLSVAMAAAMLAGPVNVPAVFHNVAIVKADEATGLKDPKTLTDIDGYFMQQLIWNMQITIMGS